MLPILERRPVFLFDLNMALLEKLLALLGLDTPIALTDKFVAPLRLSEEDIDRSALPDGAVLDGRERIQPKYKGKSLLAEYACEQAYYQVFVNEMPGQASSFIPNLSILDLLSAEGPNAASFLRI